MLGFPMDSSGFHILLYFLLLQSGSENMPVLTPPPEECWENEDKIRNTHGRSQQQRPYKCHIMKLGSFLLNLDSHVRGEGPEVKQCMCQGNAASDYH